MNKAIDILIGVAVGDAIGVPFEFSSRSEMEKNPASDMVGYRVHNQPAGTWSDDSSLTFCLAEAMLKDYNLVNISKNFIRWKNKAYWTAWGNVFDIGITTSKAISQLECLIHDGSEEKLKELKYEAEEYDNGNGSLMRILPLVFEIKGKSIEEQFETVWINSALTHKHIRAGMSCMIYLKLAEHLINGETKEEAYENTRKEIAELWEKIGFSDTERTHFINIIQNDIRFLHEKEVKSGGYVIESLEASIWCLLKTDSFEEAVLKAVNFGHDTDTTGAITGGIAAIYYSMKNIPEFWIQSLARMEDIIELGNKLNDKYA